MDDLQKKMEPSWFRLSDKAIDIARKMIDVDFSPEYFQLRMEFMKQVPKDKQCFFGSDSPMPWGVQLWYTAKEAGFLVAFDPGEDLIAVISRDDVLYKEDFAEIMQNVGLEDTEGNFNVVWRKFADILPDLGSLRECADIAVREAKEQLAARSIDEILGDATERAVEVIGSGKEQELSLD